MRPQSVSTKKMVLSAIFAGLGFVLSTFVYFPSMAPFQHFVNVLAAAFLGPWWAAGSALLCGVLRMFSGRTIQAVTSAIFGPLLGGTLWKKTHKLWLLCLGEIIGTGIFGALASYPLMRLFYGLEVGHFWVYVPYYTPSAIMGAGMGAGVILLLQRSGHFRRLLAMMEDEQ